MAVSEQCGGGGAVPAAAAALRRGNSVGSSTELSAVKKASGLAAALSSESSVLALKSRLNMSGFSRKSCRVLLSFSRPSSSSLLLSRLRPSRRYSFRKKMLKSFGNEHAVQVSEHIFFLSAVNAWL